MLRPVYSCFDIINSSQYLLFCAAIRRDSVSLSRFPFLNLVQVFPCENSLVLSLEMSIMLFFFLFLFSGSSCSIDACVVVIYWPPTWPNMPFQRRRKCIFHWRGRDWLTICDRVKISRYIHKLMHRKRATCRCPRGVMVKAMNCGIVVREFVLQSRYYVHFRANTLGKGMNPLILPPAMGK